MAHYNLIKNGTLETNTTSGTGDTTFSGSEMTSLYDGNLTSSGIALSTSGTVYFEIDLFNRILVDELSLYLSVSGTMDTALSGIDFYYKNNFQDEYILLDKTHDSYSKFYTTNLITHFAPRYIRIISDKVEGTLHELIVYNDDYVVAFGDDGTQDEVVLDEFVEYTELDIFNNNSIGTSEVDAYISVDYEKDNEFDYYLKLSSSPEGEYKGILDGIGIDSDNITDYTWQMGDFNGTKVVDNTIELITTVNTSYNAAGSWSTTNPLSQEAQHGFGIRDNARTGISIDCWDWDEESDTIYAMGKLTTDDILKLYEYSLEDNEWIFISRVDILINTEASAMIYLDGYLYILTGRYGDFGRYDLSGPVNNWEDLAVASNVSPYKANQGMCTDRQRYIYTAGCYYGSSASKSFARYDTVSGSWINMNDGFKQWYSGSANGYNVTLSHDKERDCIYLYNARPLSTGGNYIQRYDIPTDTWEPEWYYLGLQAMFDCSLGYWNNYYCYLYHSDEIHVLNLNTLVEYSFSVAAVPTYHSAHLMCFAYNNRIIVARCGHESGTVPGTVWFFDVSPDPLTDQLGEYTTPIFSLGEAYKSSYLHVDTTLTSDTNKVSFSDGPANTAMVRSNNTPPRPFAKVLSAYLVGDYYYVIEGDLINGELIKPADYLAVGYSSVEIQSSHIRRVLFDPYNLGLIVQIYETYYDDSYTFMRFEYQGGSLVYKDITSSSANYNFSSFRHLALDINGNIWMYKSPNLIVILSTSMDPILTITDNGNDFLHTLSPNKVNLGCWYTNKAQNIVINMEISGTEVCSIPMTKPTVITSTSDGGCFVLDSLDYKMYKLAYDGTTLSSFSVDNTYVFNHIVSENTEGEEQFIWALVNSSKVLKINIDGTVEGSAAVALATYILTFPGGCLVEAQSLDIVYQLDINLNIIKTWDFSGSTKLSYISGVAFATYNDILQGTSSGLRERTGDPIWNESTNDWFEVSIDENNLPLKKYHQVKLKLTAGPEEASPSVNKVLIPEPIKLAGIQSQDSKLVYLKTTFPAVSENKVYNTKLRCWWGNEEEN